MNIWTNPKAWHWLVAAFANNFVREGMYYLLAAVVFWLLLHRWLRQRLAHRLIAGWPSSADVRREMVYSFSTLLIFSAQSLVVFAAILRGDMLVYLRPGQYGYVWLALSFPAMVLWHDVYFYWTHRLLHQRWLFRRVHGVHHRSRNPSPWAAYAFHPVEA